VRVGAGFELYASDATGSIAYPVNAPAAPAQIAWPKRSATPKIAGDVNGTALTTLTLTASRQYFIPLVVPRNVTLTGLRISVTTAATGTASVGIYGNTVVSGSDTPGSLLASATGLDTGTVGDKTGSLSYALQAGTLYWVSMIANAAAVVRALAVASQQTALGRVANSASVVSHLYVAGGGATLPATASTTLTAAAGVATPAIYLIE
jgi:hypothetical protein